MSPKLQTVCVSLSACPSGSFPVLLLALEDGVGREAVCMFLLCSKFQSIFFD